MNYKNPISFWIILATSFLILAFASKEALYHLTHVWNTQEEYGYGYIIPFITIFLIWQRKNKLAELDFKFSYTGLGVVLIGCLLSMVGTIATTVTIAEYGLVVIILGVLWSLMGWASFKHIMVPLMFLFFMIPLPGFLYGALSNELQLISSEIGAGIIRAFGISVYLEGNVIDLGVYKLQVVEACSGLRYLFPLMSLSFIMAYLFHVALWKKIVLFLSSIPITVLMNSIRIGVIGVLVENFGIEQAEGFLHDFEGWVIFMACMVFLVLEAAVLIRINAKGEEKKKVSDVLFLELPEKIDLSNAKPRIFNPTSIAPIIFLIVVLISNSYSVNREPINLNRKSFSEFPIELDGWKGINDQLEPIILDSLNLDDYIMANYFNQRGESINFYVAYYGNQQATKTAHSPKACIPGGGWQVVKQDVIEISEVKYKDTSLQVNRMLIKKGEYIQVVYYWFDQRGRNITDELSVKSYMFWDSLTKNRTDGALVRVTAFLKPNEDTNLADKRIIGFIKSALPKLDKYIPD